MDDEVLDAFTCEDCRVKFGHASNCPSGLDIYQ